MKSDFIYPHIADRRSIEEWEQSGSEDIHTIAKSKTRAILKSYFPAHLPAETDRKIREQFTIRLPLH